MKTVPQPVTVTSNAFPFIEVKRSRLGAITIIEFTDTRVGDSKLYPRTAILLPEEPEILLRYEQGQAAYAIGLPDGEIEIDVAFMVYQGNQQCMYARIVCRSLDGTMVQSCIHGLCDMY